MTDVLTIAQGVGAVGTGGVVVALAYLARPVVLEALSHIRCRREQVLAEQADLRARIDRAEEAARASVEAERECQRRVAELSERVDRTEQATMQVQGLMDDPDQWVRSRRRD